MLIVAGAVAAFGGIVSGEMIYREMRLRRLSSESQVIGSVDPGSRSDWQPVELQLVESTVYCLAMIVSDSSGNSQPAIEDSTISYFPGQLDIDIADPSGITALRKSVHGAYPVGIKGKYIKWVPLDTVRVPDHGGSWRVQYRVADPDTSSGGGKIVLLFSPVQDQPFESYLQDRTPAFLLRGALILFGFISIFAGGMLRGTRARATGNG